MGDRKPWGQMIPTSDGKYVQLYEDGSSTVYDQYFNVVTDDTSPNPQRAALAHAGREREAAADAIYSRASSEDARRWEKNYTQKSTEINNTYKIALKNARTQQEVAEANRWYQEQQVGLSKDRLQFDRETQSQEFGLKQQEFGLKQANLGYDLIGTAAGLKGPSNYFAASNLARNTAAQPGTSTFLSALQNNTRLAGFGQQAGAPQGETLGTLTAKLTGADTGTGAAGNVIDGTVTAASSAPAGVAGAITTGGRNAEDNAYLNQIHGIARQGAHRLGAGRWEQLSPTEQALFLNGLETADENGAAYDPDTFLDQYRRSRIGQSLSGSRAA